MIERLRSVLEADPRVAYAILFGSRGRGSAHHGRDSDVAIGLAVPMVDATVVATKGQRFGEIVSREAAGD